MTFDMNPIAWDTRVLLVIVLLVINFLLKLKSFRTPLDYDTSSHLYFAYLKRHKVPFLSSYGFGVKYILPRLYRIGMGWMKDNLHRFRVLNIVSSSLVIILWVLSDPSMSITEIPFYFLGVLLINSMWVNYPTSTSEFHSVVLVMTMFLLPQIVPFQVAWILQLVLLALLVGGFKIVDAAYLLPVLAFYGEQVLAYNWWVGFGLVLFGVYVFRGLQHTHSSIRQYERKRTWINRKSLSFIAHCPHFCLLMLLLGVGNILWTSWEWALFQLVLWGVLLIQRTFVSYLFYPSLVLGLFIAFQTQWLNAIPLPWSWFFVLAVFFGHTLFDILLRSPREIDIRYRKWISSGNWRSYLDTRDRQIQWLKDHLKSSEYVYLWGSHVALLLLSRLIHAPNTFYSHNHLIYWSDIKDKKRYAFNYLLKEQPRYVIESEIIENIKFPADRLKKLYTQIGSVGNMTVYERIGQKIKEELT